MEALEVVAPTLGPTYQRLLNEVRQKVITGSDISHALGESPFFAPMVVGMVGVGERTGHLPELLQKLAEHYEEELEFSLAQLLSLLEPLLIVFMAGVVGFIVLSILLPILSLSDVARGG